MRTGADQVEIANAFGSIVEPEPGRLAKQRRHREARTVGAQVVASEVLGRHVEVARDAVAQIRQDGAGQRRDDARLQPRAFDLPIDRTLQVGHGAQHVETVAARRREAGIGRRGTVQVERKIFRQDLVVEDVGQQLAISLAEPDRVVRDVRILARGAEIQHEQAHRILGCGQFQACRTRLRFGPDHRAVQMRRVDIGHDDVGGHREAVVQGHTRGDAVLDLHTADGGVESDNDPLPGHQ